MPDAEQTAHCTPGEKVTGWTSATAGGTLTLWPPDPAAENFGATPGTVTLFGSQGSVGMPVVDWRRVGILVSVPTPGPGTDHDPPGSFWILVQTSTVTFKVSNVHIHAIGPGQGYPPGPPMHHLS